MFHPFAENRFARNFVRIASRMGQVPVDRRSKA